MIKETQLEARKSEFMMLTTIAGANIPDPQKREEFTKTVSKSWKQYLSSLFGVELPEITPEEEALKEYYSNVVSKLRPKIRKDRKTGKVSVSGLENMQF